MGSRNCENRRPEDVLREAIAGGITLFQFREKGDCALEGTAKLELGRRLFTICREHGIPFIVNDDVELMLALDADGLHIGQEDGSARAMRNRIGDKILGISAHDLYEARAALADGADYLGVGPMYETQTKPDIREVRGPDVIREIRGAGIACPIVGIGGITHGKAAPVIAAGANGIAVISAISQAIHPKEAAKKLMQEVRSR
ncbi:thiamine phosphate synthase [Brevibacillus fluminis]|uniref:thiamine phosphate synthase n=1 Tax=Brevibacillus fluminis TaxID=511487 RepID=UPI003F8A9F19